MITLYVIGCICGWCCYPLVLLVLAGIVAHAIAPHITALGRGLHTAIIRHQITRTEAYITRFWNERRKENR